MLASGSRKCYLLSMIRHRLAFLLLMLLFLPFICNGQYASNVTYALGKDAAGKDVYSITYDLVAPYTTIPCHVAVWLSNEFDQNVILEDVTGDVGDLIYPGKGKKIEWDYVRELVHYSGDVSINIEVKPNIKVPEKIKRGKKLVVEPSSILATSKTYEVKLFRVQQELNKLSDLLVSDTTMNVSLPEKVKLKGKYQLCIVDGEKKYFSNTFRIRPKVGYGWKAIPILLIPAYILFQNYQDKNEPLPGPPVDIIN